MTIEASSRVEDSRIFEPVIIEDYGRFKDSRIFELMLICRWEAADGGRTYAFADLRAFGLVDRLRRWHTSEIGKY